MAKQSTKQKFLSVLLAVSMMAGMFPAGAIAEDELLPASAAAVAEEASADSETVQTPDIQPEEDTSAPVEDALEPASEAATANEDEAAAPGTPDVQTPTTYAAADAAVEEQAYFIDKVKLVPIDIQPELKVPEDYTQVWEPEVQWDLAKTDISRDANVYLWFKYVMPDADHTPKKGVPYTAIVKAPLTCAEPQHTVITCGQDEVAKVEVAKTETPGELKMTIWFEENADNKYFAPDVPGYFWVATQFDADLINNDGKQQIEVSVDGEAKDTPTIGFAFTKPTFSAKVEKKHAEQADAEDGKEEITWTSTVTIESHDLPSGDHKATVTLDDTMKNQKYVKGSAEVIAVDGAESSAVAITESDPAFDETENGDHVSFTLQNVPLSNEPHTVTIRYKTTYADMEYLPIQVDSKTVAAKVEFRNAVNGTVTVPRYEKNADGEVVPNGEQTVDAGESADATYLTVAQLTKTVSTTDLSGANITTADGKLLWQIFIDSDLANQEIIDTIGNGHELVLDAQHPLTIGDYAKDKDGNYVYVGTPVTCTGFLAAGSKEAGIFEGKAVGSSKQYVISLGEKTGKTMITYYTQINGTTESLVNKAEFRAEGFGDGTTLPYQRTFNMRSTFLAKESNINTGYDPKTQKITWKVTVNGGGYLPGGITLVDEFCKSIGVANPKKYDQKLVHEETDPFTLTVTRNEQATEYVLDNGTLTADGIYSIVNKNDPTEILGTIKIAGDSYEDTGFTLALTNLQAGYDSVVLNYKTQLLASDQEDVATDLKSWINNKTNTVQVCNKITLQQGNGRPNITSAYWVYANTPVLKKEPILLDADGFAAAGDAAGNRNYDYETGEAAWKITVNEAQMAFDSDIVLYDVLDYGSDAAWSYVEDSVKVKLAGQEITNFTTSFSQTADGKPTMTVTLPAVASGQGAYVVTYKTKVNKQPTADRPGLDSNKEQTLKNTVTLTGGPIVSGVTADSSVKITAGKISKSGSKDDAFGRNHLVTWEIVVNKNLADLSQAGSDKIVIRDDLELGLQYMEDPTVQKFTKTKIADDGTIVPDGLEDADLSGEWADYDPETRRLTFTFTKEDLRETGYVIRYQTRVMDGQKHSNSASYSVTGTTSEKDSAGDTVNSYYGNGFTVIPGTGTVLIRKQKSDGTALAGATFTVSQEIDGRWVEIGKLTTDGSYSTIEDAGTFEENAAMVGLKYGHYKVEETAAPDGYVNGHFAQEFTLSSEHATQEITCTNYRTNEGGWLELTKTISGPIAADTVMPTVQFTVTGPDGAQVGVYTLDQFVKGEDGTYTLKIGKILPPGSYTVTETAQTPEGYTAQTTYTVNGTSAEGMTAQAAIVPGETTIIAFANTYQRTVRIAKVDAANPTQTVAGAKLTLTKQDDAAFSVRTWWSEAEPTVFQLDAGTYVLSEMQSPADYDLTKESVKFTVNADGTVTGEGIDFAGDAVATIALCNEEKGSLVLTKTVTGPLTKEDAEASIRFTVTGPDGYHETFALTDGFVYDEAANTWTKTLDHLTRGSYTVTENVTAVDGRVLSSVTATVNGEDVRLNGENTATVTVSSRTDTAVAYKNTYKRVVYVDKIDAATKKSLSGAALALTKQGDEAFGKITWTSEAGSPKQFVLDAGTYILTETASPEKYDLMEGSVEFTVNADGTVTGEGINFAGDAVATIALSNEEKGSLVLTKTVTGPLTKEDAEASIRFTVTGPDGYHEIFALTDGFVYDETANTWTKTLTHLTRGEYTVTETITQDVEGYTLAQVSTKVQVGDGEPALTETDRVVRGDEIKVTAEVESSKTTTVAYTNSYRENPKPTPPIASPTPVPSTTPQPAAAPQVSIPQTGDTFPLLPTALIMAASGLALAVLAVAKRRKKNK